MSERTEVVLWGDHPTAIDATRETMRELGSDLIEEGGRFFIPAPANAYPVWAALHQGYVRGLAAKEGE